MVRWRVLLVLLLLLLVLGQPLLTRQGRRGLVAFGRDLTLARGEQVEGDVVAFGGDLRLEPGSAVHGSALAYGGSLRLGGQVDGDAIAFSGDIALADTAVVGGDALASGLVTRQPGALVGGQAAGGGHRGLGLLPVPLWRGRGPVFLPSLWFGWPWAVGLSGNLLVWAVQVLLGSLFTICLGLLVVLVAPKPTGTAGEALAAHPLLSLGVGLGTGLATLFVVPVLAATCIGLPLAALAALALAVGLLLGWIAAGLAIGRRVLGNLGQSGRGQLLAVATGLLVLAALAGVPWLGLLLTLLATIWGLGAVILTRFGTAPYAVKPPRVAPPGSRGGRRGPS